MKREEMGEEWRLQEGKKDGWKTHLLDVVKWCSLWEQEVEEERDDDADAVRAVDAVGGREDVAEAGAFDPWEEARRGREEEVAGVIWLLLFAGPA